MIKVGDYLKFKTIVNGMVVEHIDRIEHVEETPNEKVMVYFENMEHGVLFNDIYDSNLVDFKKLYQQQKQRADELEKSLKLINSSQENLVNELQNALSESNKRADKYEKRWNELKEIVAYESKEAFAEGDTNTMLTYDFVLDKMNELEDRE